MIVDPTYFDTGLTRGTVSLNNKDILTQVCFEQIPYSGKYILAFAIFAFATTTVLGWFYYGEQCIRFLANRKWVLNGYKIIYILFAFLGSIGSLSIVWDFADLANGLMVIPNASRRIRPLLRVLWRAYR